MNIEELFENEKWAGYVIVVPRRDVNQSIDYLKTKVMEYVAGLEKRIAELELRLGCRRDASAGKDLLIAELEEQNRNMMALFRDFYELEFNRDECWEIIKKYGGDA